MSECRCRETDRLEGVEAQKYTRDHLVEVAVDDVNWIVVHRCPDTDLYWKESFPQSEAHGGGPQVLERISRNEAAELLGRSVDEL